MRSESETLFAEIENPKQRAFLAAYRETGNIRLSADAAKISRRSVYNWLEADPGYVRAHEEAKAEATELLEAEARRRAVEGVEEPVGWYKGEAGGTVRRYSDNLLMFLLKGLAPEKYRERVDVRTSLKSLVSRLNWDALPDHLVARLAQGEHPLSVLASAADQVERYLLSPGVELGGPGAGSRDEPDDGGRSSSGSDDGDGLDTGDDL